MQSLFNPSTRRSLLNPVPSDEVAVGIGGVLSGYRQAGVIRVRLK